MITLHKLNGAAVVINAELIECLEAGGGQETVVALATGNRFRVKETPEEICELVMEYRRKLGASGKAVNPIQGFERRNP